MLITTPLLFGVLATLPLGPAGYSIIENTINSGFKKGIQSLFELQAVELIYLGVALLIFKYVENVTLLKEWGEVITIFVLFGFGILTFLESRKKGKEKREKKTFVWALLNPGILILYITFISNFKSSGLVTLIPFQAGSIITLLALVLIATVSRENLLEKMNKIKQGIAGLFILTAVSKMYLTIF